MLTRSDYLLDPTGAGQPAALPVPSQVTLPRVFAAAVARDPQAPAVFVPGPEGTGGQWRTWAQWQADADALAVALAGLGVAPGDVVAVHLPNSWEFLTLHVAAACLGAVTFPLHMAYGGYELGLLARRARPRVLAVPASHRGADIRRSCRRVVDSLPDPCALLVAGGPDDPGEVGRLTRAHRGSRPAPVPVRPDDPLSVMVSSGTSSTRPKLCVHTHAGQLGNAAATAADGAARAADTVLSASPFTHLFGLLSVHLSVVCGGRQALLPAWHGTAVRELAARAGASVLFAVPAQLRDLVAAVAAGPGGGLPRLREVRTGGAPVPADLVARTAAVLGAGVVVQWGMSELGAGTFTRPGDPAGTVAGTIGRPVTGGQAVVVTDDGRWLRAGERPGQTGELWYRSATMFRGYLGDPERTAEAVTPDGWLRTGDLAAWTADGNLEFRGRRTEFLNRGGLKYSAVEVENLLAELPELAQFAILGRTDERLGQRAVLVAAVRPGCELTLPRVTAHLARRGLARYKWPEQLVLVDELPTTPTGKVARARLADLLAGDRAQRDHPPAQAGPPRTGAAATVPACDGCASC